MSLPYIAADHVRTALSPAQAVDALRQRLLRNPPAPARPGRTFVPVRQGELLLMPDESDATVGLKVLSIARANPERGIPAIQGVYLLMDAETLTPQALLDAAELTCVRTAAVSLLAVTSLHPPATPNVVVIGSGPQALAHCEASAQLNPSSISIIARNPTHGDTLVKRARARGVDVSVGGTAAIKRADVIFCCTTSREPVLHVNDVKSDVIIVAIGSHEPSVRELDTDVLDAAFVVVESRTNARREAGDVIIAESEVGRPLISADLVELVTSDGAPSQGRRVFKSVGDAWEDLTIAQAIVDRLS